MAPSFKKFLHVVLVIGVLVVLGFINYIFHLDNLLRTSIPILAKVWLPLLFLLVYVLSWLGWWLWKLLEPEEEISGFPDIDEAWDEAVRALEEKNIDLTEAPLFLIVGKTAATEEALFAAAQLQLTVKQAPRRSDAPLHVYGNRDG